MSAVSANSRRRFIANVRRTLRLYLTLLYTNEDMGTLAAVVSYITDYSQNRHENASANHRELTRRGASLLSDFCCEPLRQGSRLWVEEFKNHCRKNKRPCSLEKKARIQKRVRHKRRRSHRPKLDVYLEQAYNVWFDFAVPARGNMLSWEQNVDEAFTQLEVEESRTDEGPDLVKEPYKTAFSSASKFTKSSPEMNFEQYALECITDLEAKSDLNTLAARLSLCQKRFREIEPEADAQVKESGMNRLKILGNALKDAFIRCSAPTIELLAKGEIKLCPGGLENVEEETSKKDNDAVVDEAKEGTEAVNSPQKSTPTKLHRNRPRHCAASSCGNEDRIYGTTVRVRCPTTQFIASSDRCGLILVAHQRTWKTRACLSSLNFTRKSPS